MLTSCRADRPALDGMSATPCNRLQDVPAEVLALIIDAIQNERDLFSLWFALGAGLRVALRDGLESYKWLVTYIPKELRLQVAQNVTVDDSFLRRYVHSADHWARHAEAMGHPISSVRSDTLWWLNLVAAQAAAATEGVAVWAVHLDEPERPKYLGNGHFMERHWYLVKDGVADSDATLRLDMTNGLRFLYYNSSPLLVRAVYPEGEDETSFSVVHFEKAGGAWRKVLAEMRNGTRSHFQGKPGHEKLVQISRRSTVRSREMVRARPDRTVQYHKGKRGAERVVRRRGAPK